jgi:hypothetical protein
MAIVRALPGYRDRGRPFLAFVQTVARHRIANAYAVLARTPEVAVWEVSDAMTTADDPEQHLLEAADADALAALLDRLPRGSARCSCWGSPGDSPPPRPAASSACAPRPYGSCSFAPWPC